VLYHVPLVSQTQPTVYLATLAISSAIIDVFLATQPCTIVSNAQILHIACFVPMDRVEALVLVVVLANFRYLRLLVVGPVRLPSTIVRHVLNLDVLTVLIPSNIMILMVLVPAFLLNIWNTNTLEFRDVSAVLQL